MDRLIVSPSFRTPLSISSLIFVRTIETLIGDNQPLNQVRTAHQPLQIMGRGGKRVRLLLFNSMTCSNLNRADVVVDLEEEVEAEEVGAIEVGKTIE